MRGLLMAMVVNLSGFPFVRAAEKLAGMPSNGLLPIVIAVAWGVLSVFVAQAICSVIDGKAV